MRMVSVDRLKPTVSDHNIPNNTVRIQRLVLPHRLTSDHVVNFFSGDTGRFFKEGFSDMDRGPTIFDSMFHPDLFSSMYDGIRLGRHHRYKLSHPFHMTDTFDPFDDFEPSSSSKVRVIPIKVVHGSSSSSLKQPEERLSPKPSICVPATPIVIDDSEETENKSPFSKQSKSRASPDSKLPKKRDAVYSVRETESPIIIDDNVTELSKNSLSHFCPEPSKESKSGSKSSIGMHHIEGGKSNVLASVPIPVQHLNSSTPSLSSKTLNLDSKRSLSLSPSHEVISEAMKQEDIHIDDIDVDVTTPRNTSKSVSPQPKSAYEDSDFFDTEQEINPAPSYPIYGELKVKLEADNRKIDYIRGDGNCFFRALSKQLYGSERYHKAVRRLVVDIIATNKTKFAQFVDGDVQEHVDKMSENHCWATTCEIYAAATLLQRDIYMLTPDHLNKHYSWLLFRPVFKSTTEQNGVSSHPCYITFCNTNGNHYDRIVPDHGGCNCFAPKPEMDGISDSVDLTSPV